MCGIAGIIARDRELTATALPAMVSAQLHRGPDDGGQAILPFGQRFLGLGHRRLSILDLSSAGHQPMVHPDTRDHIVFNGEIYNFQALRREMENDGERFRGHSDTEVLLHGLSRWGPEFLRRLEGMYALLFYDARQQRILAVRDPLGIKPLYVYEKDGLVLFASEVRSILAAGVVDRKLNMQAVATYLAFGAVQAPNTIFQDIESFPPGSHRYFDASTNGPPNPAVKFWDFPSPGASQGYSESDIVQSVHDTLTASVRDHLVSDVPVGVMLSSGLDSSIISAIAARHSSHMRSFAVGFADEPDLSELEMARETARIYGLEHTEIDITGKEAEESATKWLATLDQPSFDGLNVYIISRVVRAQGIRVALSGLGGDELFGGYPSFTDVPQLYRFLKIPRLLPKSVRLFIGRAVTNNTSQSTKQKIADILRGDGSILHLYFQRRRVMSDLQLSRLGVRYQDLGLLNSYMPPMALEDVHVNSSDLIASISQLETRFYMGNVLLRDSDTNGMAHGLEIRVPMLDQRMLNLAFGLQGKTLMPHGCAPKHLLRRAFIDDLRPELLSQRKRGFILPLKRWMRGPLRELCQSGLAALKSMGLVDPAGVDSLWNAFLDEPESTIWSRTFTLCVLGIYLQQIGGIQSAAPSRNELGDAAPDVPPAPAIDRPSVAIINNSYTPYRDHLERRIVDEVPEMRLYSIYTHEESNSPWPFAPSPQTHPVLFGPNEPAMNQERPIRYALHELRKGGRIIDYLKLRNISAVVMMGYNDVGRLRVMRWCSRHNVPCFLFGDSNIRGDHTRGLKSLLKKVLLTNVVGMCRGFMVCGRLGTAYFQKYGAAEDRIFYFPYEPDYELIWKLGASRLTAMKEKFDLKDHRRRIVCSGRQIEVKRPDQVIDAFAAIAEQRPEWDLVMVGSGRLHDELVARVPIGLENRVIWTGFVSDQADVSAVYLLSDIMVLASSYEPWGLVINEAAAAGMAIVSSDVVGASAELVQNGVNGCTFPTGDLQKLIECLLNVTAPEKIDAFKAGSTQVLKDWRRRGDPIRGLKSALRWSGVLRHLE